MSEDLAAAGQGPPLPPWDAIVLLAHGSRDPSWSRPVEAIAARVRGASARSAVVCAYLEFTQPDLPLALQRLAQDGAVRQVKIVPLFLGMGRHAREDLPRLMAAAERAHPHLRLWMQAPIGEESRLLDLVAQLAWAPPEVPEVPDR